jgi:uncharacterized membrane protein YgdD (TMEM256/DUF423 family)
MTSWESFDNVNSIREVAVQRGMNVLTIYVMYLYIHHIQSTNIHGDSLQRMCFKEGCCCFSGSLVTRFLTTQRSGPEDTKVTFSSYVLTYR